MPRSSPPTSALYVRLPAADGAKLDRAAEALGARKKDLIAGLVARYVDPDSERGLVALGELATPDAAARDEKRPAVGFYSFHPHPLPEVLTPQQAAELLQVEEGIVLELAESGEIPARKLGTHWRLSRAAVMSWLSASRAEG